MVTVDSKGIFKFDTNFSLDWGSISEYMIPLQRSKKRWLQSAPNQYVMKNLADVLEKLCS